jgi:type II secretion system protein H
MRGQKGFSLAELMVVIALIATIASLALPSLIDPVSVSKLRGAGDNLRGDLHLARARAVRDAVPVAVVFTAAGYSFFTDEGATPRSLDAGETLIRSRQFSAGVRCELNATNFPSQAVRFDTRGRVDQSGVAVLTSNTGKQLQVVVSLLGQVTTQ